MDQKRRLAGVLAATMVLAAQWTALAQSALVGTVRDETGAALPGVSVRVGAGTWAREVVTDGLGNYRVDAAPSGPIQLTFALINFAAARRDVSVPSTGNLRVDVTLQLSMDADVTVTGKATFTNLADLEDPAQNLVGIAQSASQGAITARQLDARPVLRGGEVLETVPGVVISQHSGEGKANQYYLRGFNLDHGTDFATAVAGVPVNLPTHGHGHGYSDLNFLVPELVSGVQFSKGPYFAEHGDFATAGAANVNYVNVLARPIVRVTTGEGGYRRALAAGSVRIGTADLLASMEINHNDGPWTRPDDYRRINALVRYTRGDSLSGFSLTGMAYRGTWSSTDQIPRRALSTGILGRFDGVDDTDGGGTYRYSGSFEWQRTRGSAATKAAAYGISYDLNLFSNFTYFLDDPTNGDQFRQADRRFVAGGRVTHRRLGQLAGRPAQNTLGIQLRNDDIANVGLYHTVARRWLGTVREDSVTQTSAAVYAQNETAWTPWLRTLSGLRADGYRFRVDADDLGNGGTAYAGIVSPKAGAVFGPWRGTELYANAGFGFHSNDARGATISRDPATGEPANRVTPLVRAKGAEVGVRSVIVPHLQTSVALWRLDLASELVFVGDAGTTEAGRPSHRSGIEWANYYSPRRWLILDGDVAISGGHFSPEASGTLAGVRPARIPGSVETVLTAGITVDSVRGVYGSARLRYFGPRALVEDDSIRSKATSLVNVEVGYRLTRKTRIAMDAFNIFNSLHSDIDYYYRSRLPGEPADGLEDVHIHPTLPRTIRLGLVVDF